MSESERSLCLQPGEAIGPGSLVNETDAPLDGFVDLQCTRTHSVIEFEWFVYGAMAGYLAPHAWPFILTCIEEFQIARRDWKKRD